MSTKENRVWTCPALLSPRFCRRLRELAELAQDLRQAQSPGYRPAEDPQAGLCPSSHTLRGTGARTAGKWD